MKATFTAKQMAAINLMIAEAVATAVVAATQAQPTMGIVTATAAAAAPKTLAQAKHDSLTMRTTRGVAWVNDKLGVVGNWGADKLSTGEVYIAPKTVEYTGRLCAATASGATKIGTKLSSFADRMAEARVRMEFAK